MSGGGPASAAAREPRTSPSPPFDLEAIRRRIPILARAIPLNNCSQAPQSDATRAAAEAYLATWDERGMDWEEWMAEVERARGAFARLIAASPDEVAVTASVSAAVSAVASALRFDAARDTVVASGMEFPAVGQAWLAQAPHGARVRWVPVRDPLGAGVTALDDWERAIDERTRVVSAAHAWFQNGALQDVPAIARLAHERGALVFVDAYQSLGTRPIDPRALGADFLAGGTLKYLMGTPGIAFLWVRPEIIAQLEPTVTGWFGRANPFAFDPRTLDWSPTARRFDGGTPPILPAYVARAGIELLAEVGLEHIGAWTATLAARARDEGLARGLVPIGPADAAHRTPVTAFLAPDAAAAEASLRERGIIVSARGAAVRVAPHFYNTLDDVGTGVARLAECLAEQPPRTTAAR